MQQWTKTANQLNIIINKNNKLKKGKNVTKSETKMLQQNKKHNQTSNKTTNNKLINVKGQKENKRKGKQ